MSSRDDDLIGPMASFIASRLQYRCPRINGQGNPWVSTISIDQHKEKFGFIRVYCTLADPDLVKQKWDWLKANQKVVEHLPLRLNNTGLLEGDDPTPEFALRCLKHDAVHYREVYMEMVALQPHLIGRICGQADYSELLRPTFEELSHELDDVSTQGESWSEGLLRKYRSLDLNELKEYLRVVYHPTWKDVMGRRG